jgi:predicted nuclease of restriction endonuclease-like (RecB) superfamily
LRNFREFYLTYPNRVGEIRYPVGSELTPTRRKRRIRYPPGSESHAAFNPNLSWSHYRALMRVKKPDARDFYEKEAAATGWGKRQLERQIGSLYYERLLVSRDKRTMLAENRNSTGVAHPLEVIKDPYVLEFLGLPEGHQLNETELEEQLITHIQAFLLELGQGFAFIGRQHRLTLYGDHFYADLVFYHVRLKCFIIVDLKTRKLTHADLGQMKLYVNYYDREVAGVDDNPTLGLILCTDKNDAVVRYVLDEDQETIFASRYQMALPSEAELAAEVRREIASLALGEPLSKSLPANPARKQDPPRTKIPRKKTP